MTVVSRYCGIPWTSLLGGPFSYLINHSAENKTSGGGLVWEVTSSIFKVIGNGLLLGFIEQILFVALFSFYIIFGSGQAVQNFHHLGQ